MDKIKVLTAILLSFIPSVSSAYLFGNDPVTGKPVKLNVTEANPKAYFRISGSAPAFKNKEKFLGGEYADADDSTFFEAVVMESMKKWNDVEDSYVELVLEDAAGPGPNEEDKINNISIGSGSWSDSGSALPTTGQTSADSHFIVDCDITLDNETDVEKFADTVLHELGHCLGLKHPHYSTKSVMSYSNLGKKFELALDDKAGITVLYPVAYEKRKHLIPVCGSIGVQLAPFSRGGSNRNSNAAWIFIALPLFVPLKRALRRIKRANSLKRD